MSPVCRPQCRRRCRPMPVPETLLGEKPTSRVGSRIELPPLRLFRALGIGPSTLGRASRERQDWHAQRLRGPPPPCGVIRPSATVFEVLLPVFALLGTQMASSGMVEAEKIKVSSVAPRCLALARAFASSTTKPILPRLTSTRSCSCERSAPARDLGAGQRSRAVQLVRPASSAVRRWFLAVLAPGNPGSRPFSSR